MENVYLLVAFIAVMATTVGVILTLVDHHLDKKLVDDTSKIVCEDIIPAAEMALENLTKELLEQTNKMTNDMMEQFKDPE